MKILKERLGGKRLSKVEMDPEKLLQKARGINPELYEVLAEVMDKTCYQRRFLLTPEEAAFSKIIQNST